MTATPFDACAACYESLSPYDGAVLIAETAAGNNVITAKGNWVDAPVVFGEVYEFRYRFSGFRLQNPGNGMLSPNRAKARVRRVFLRYHRTRYFKVTVIGERREPQVYEFDGVTLDSRGSQIGSRLGTGLDLENPHLYEGVFQFPMLGDGSRAQVEIQNDTAVPCQFINCEWVGTPSRNTLT